MDNSPGDTNSRINPFSIENILSPPSSQTMQSVSANQPSPQLYYMAFMLQQQLQQQQQQQQHFRHLQHFQQQQQYLQSFFLLQQQLAQQQQQQLLPLKQGPQVQPARHHLQHQHQQRHLLQPHLQQVQQRAHKQHLSSHKSHLSQSSPPPLPGPQPAQQPVAVALTTSAAKLSAQQQQQRPQQHEQSTALSSLSSFVARIEPLAPQTGIAKKTTPTVGGGGNSLRQNSGGPSPAPSGKLKQSPIAAPATGTRPAQTPTPTPTPNISSTLNTAINIAKAPPELVQKQPAWVFCTRYSDRPSSGPRTRRAKSKDKKAKEPKASLDEKRPRTAFTNEQLEKLRQEFKANSYLDERRRKDLADRLGLNENQIKIWFQNKRAKMKKQSNQPNPLRGLLVAGGLYNHSTATSDCSESYANGNDHEDDEIDHDNDDDNNNITGRSQTQALKRPREQQHQQRQQQQCNSGKITFNNTEAETGMMSGSAPKRMRLDYAASDAASESSRNLDEDELVISVS